MTPQPDGPRYALIPLPEATADVVALAVHGVDVVAAAMAIADDLAQGRVVGKDLGRRNVSGDLTGLARVKFDVPGQRPQRSGSCTDSSTRPPARSWQSGHASKHVIYRLAASRLSQQHR